MERPRERSVVMTVVAAAASMAVFGVGMARATDQGVTGKKLLLKSGKFVLLSKDPSIGVAGSDPVGGADSSVSFNDGSGPVSLALPKTLWSANGSATVFKYKNPDAPSGPSVAKVAKVSGGLLKAVGTGAPLAVPNGAATIDVVLTLDGGTNTYCMTFVGTGDGSKFLVKDAAAGTCPGSGAVTPTPTPPAATPTDTPGGACAASGYPACGGSCPSGQVCQAMQVVNCDGCTGSAFCGQPVTSCTCVPAAGTCAGSVFDPTCSLYVAAAFTYGPCPSGEICFESDVLSSPVLRSCQAPPTPVPTGTPATSCPSGGQLVGGYCWWFGNYSANCDDTCAAAGLLCDAATDTYAGFDGTLAHCQAVENAIGPMPSVTVNDVHSAFAGMGCAWEYPFAYREADWPPTSCSAADSNHRRFCACHP